MNTKLSAVVDAFGRSVGLSLAAGNRHDIKAMAPLLERLADCWAVGVVVSTRKRSEPN